MSFHKTDIFRIPVFIITLMWFSLLFLLNLPPSPLRSLFDPLARIPNVFDFEASGWHMYARPGSFNFTPVSKFVFTMHDGSKEEWVTLPIRQGFKTTAWRLLTFRMLKNQIPFRVKIGIYSYWCRKHPNFSSITHQAFWIPIEEHKSNGMIMPKYPKWKTYFNYKC